MVYVTGWDGSSEGKTLALFSVVWPSRYKTGRACCTGALGVVP